MLKKRLMTLIAIILLIPGISRAREFSIGGKGQIMPAVADVDYDEIPEIIIVKENGEVYIINSENLDTYSSFYYSNWTRQKDVFLNSKDDRIFGVRIPFKGETGVISAFVFDVNEDGIDDIILGFKSGRIIALNYYGVSQSIAKGEDPVIATHIIWENRLEADEITGGFSLFQSGSIYHLAVGSKTEYLYFINLKTGIFSGKVDLFKFSTVPDRMAVECAPLIIDVNGDRVMDIVAASNSGSVTALDGRTKTKIWTYTKKNSPILFSPTYFTDLSGRKMLILPFKEYRIAAVAAETGKELWTLNTGAPILSSVIAADIDKDSELDAVFASSDGKLYCVDAGNGAIKWTYDTIKVHAPVVVFDFNKDMFPDIILSNENGIMEVINSKTRTLLPKYKFVTKGVQTIKTQPILGDLNRDGILDIGVSSSDGMFYFFSDPENYEIEEGQLLNVAEKGDVFHTGNIRENSKNNAKINSYLLNARKKRFYKEAQDFLNTENITNAAVYFKKVINIDPEYEDAAAQFGKIKDKFLSYEYTAYVDALKNDDLKKAIKILTEVENTSADFDKIPEMKTMLEKKKEDFKKADEIFAEGKKEIEKGQIVSGYEKVEKAKALNTTNRAYDKLLEEYQYQMTLYRALVSAVTAKNWKAAQDNFKKLTAKDPDFPGIATYKNQIFINKNLPLFIIGAVLLVAASIGITIAIKKKKKLTEEMLKQKVIESKVEIASDTHFEESAETEEGAAGYGGGLSVDHLDAHGIDLAAPGQQEVPASEPDSYVETSQADEGGIELGGIDLGVDQPESGGLPGMAEEGLSSDMEEHWGSESGLGESGSDMETENLEVRINMAKQMYENENFEEAKEEFEKLSEKESPFRFRVLAYLGFCYYALGNTDLSMEVIKKIPYQKEEIPVEERKEILNILADGFLKNGLGKPAMGVLKKVLELADGADKKNILYKIGSLNVEMGNKSEAVKYFKELFLIDPNYKDVSEKLDELGFS